MLVEIDKDFYCSGGFYKNGWCDFRYPKARNCEKCSMRHRKYQTPEQYKEEYGEEWTDDDAVYCFIEDDWFVISYGRYKELYSGYLKQTNYNEYAIIFTKYPCICASSPYRKPPQDWRPT